MAFRIILDMRERHLAENLQALKVSFELRTLDLGDIIITNDPHSPSISNTETNNAASRLLGSSKNEEKIEPGDAITLVIERKSFTDLKASLSDGRYHEQKSRYLQLPRGTIFYILEDNDPRYEQLDQKQFLGMYIHTMIRDQIGVFLTRSLEETAKTLIKIRDTIEEFGLNYRDKVPICKLNESQIKKKKAYGKDVYIQHLCCFPGINKTKAQNIASVYPSMIELIESLKHEQFKVKGIGKKLIAGIKDGIFCSPTTTKQVQVKAKIQFD